MSILPALYVIFDPAMPQADRARAVEQLRDIKGILSVSFNAGAGRASVTYLAGQDVHAKIRALDPRLGIDPRPRF